MKINSQLKNAQFELVDDCPTDAKKKGRVTYNTECKQVQVGDGDDCKRVQDNSDVPIGMIMIWPSLNAPDTDRWLPARGDSVLTADHPELFAIIGYGYGGSGTSFNLPDYRGEFLRGRDAGAGRDPDRNTRTNRGDGTTGNNIGTKQADEFQTHNHTVTDRYTTIARDGESNNDHFTHDGFVNVTRNTTSTGGSETRPRNVYVDYYIKVK